MIQSTYKKLLFLLILLQNAYNFAITSPHIKVINLAQEKVNFTPGFLFGAATSSSQNEEESETNTWSKQYLSTILGKENLRTPGFACHSWEHWQDDIDKVAYLGCNSYRFSIEWSRIQPTADNFDEAAIEHYVAMAKYCQENNIQPMVCLHHYSDPIWFMEQGGFAQEENLEKFEAYCKKMYEALRPYVSQWIVISQPTAYALKGYHQAMQPPYLKSSGLENTVMLNMFKAHMNVYDIMHNSYDSTHIGCKPQVGICHQIVQMQTSKSGNIARELAEQFIAKSADRLTNKTFLRFFSTGYFRALIPKMNLGYCPQAPTKFDFFALSYYSPLAFTWMKAGAPATTDDLQAQDGFRIIHKEGMYDAIVQASQLGKPIYIIENGINTKYDQQRELLLNSYLSAISQAIQDGFDVRSYFHWTLMDDYEWANGKLTDKDEELPSEFGLYKNRVINQKTGQLRTDFKDHEQMLKPSGHHYKDIIKLQKQ